MPHPLPEDIDSVSGLKWFLAAVPDDPAFTRAAWDVFTELANYWKWGMEGPVPEDSDKAAQLWSNAVYETIEAYQMGFPDVLLGYIDEIEGLLQSLQFVSCCANTSVTGDTVTSDITPDVGDPPAEWGDGEAVSDWEDWRQLVCGASNTWVDHLKDQVDLIEDYLDAGLLIFGVVASLLSAGAAAGILIAIRHIVVIEATSAILANANNLVFGDIKSGLESARAEIRCAIFDGCEDLETVIEGAVGALAWSAWYQFYDWCSIRNSLLEGQFNGGFHAVSRSELCACTATYDLDWTYTFESSGDWPGASSDRLSIEGPVGSKVGRINAKHPNGDARVGYHNDSVASWASYTGVRHYLALVEFDVANSSSFPGGFDSPYAVKCNVFYNDGTSDVFDVPSPGHYSFTPDPTKLIREGTDLFVRVEHQANGDDTDKSIELDNIRVALNEL